TQERRQSFVYIRVDQPVDAPFPDTDQIRHGDRRVIERHSQRRSVKITAADYVAAFRKNQRIIGCRATFYLDNACGMLDRVAYRSMYLGHAPQTVRVLHARIVRQMRTPDLAVFQQVSQMSRHGCLTPMRPDLLNASVERARRAAQRLER